MNPATNQDWTEEDEADYIAGVALMDDPNFLRWMARCERGARKTISRLGENAGAANPQELVAAMAMYNTVERLPTKMKEWVLLVLARKKAQQPPPETPKTA